MKFSNIKADIVFSSLSVLSNANTCVTRKPWPEVRHLQWVQVYSSVADPGFPVGGGGGGGVDPLRGVDLRRGCFLAKMCVKMKEFGPVGGRATGTPP